MEIIIHKINTVKELRRIRKDFGTEIDIKSYKSKLILNHEPYKSGDLLENYLSTYDNVFLTPYIKYAISIITQYFEKKNILYESELINHNKLQDKIYKRNDYYILRKALYTIVPKDDNMFNFPHIIKNKNKYGYIFARKMENENIYILKIFDKQNVFKRSIFEVSPSLIISTLSPKFIPLGINIATFCGCFTVNSTLI